MMVIPYQKRLVTTARELRKKQTIQENHLWHDFLKHLNIRFTRQKIINGFIVDFYCREAKLIIELDGNQHYSEESIAYDNERSLVLNKYNLRVLRFKNSQIDDNFDECCKIINQTIVEQINNQYSPTHPQSPKKNSATAPAERGP